jgi:hypothetical protein
MSEAKAPQGKVKIRKVKPVKTDAKPRTEIDYVNKAIRVVYDSTNQIRRHFEEEPTFGSWLKHFCNYAPGDQWMSGSFTPERALECATGGLMDNVELIKTERQRAEKLDVQVMFPSWQADIAGALADVPAFLAGDPQSMRRMVNQVSDTRPVRIFVGMASSCTFNS